MKKKLFYLKLMFLTLISVQMNAQEVLDQSQTISNQTTRSGQFFKYRIYNLPNISGWFDWSFNKNIN